MKKNPLYVTFFIAVFLISCTFFCSSACAESSSGRSVDMSFNEVSSWTENNTTYHQIQCSITNTSSSDINDWSVKIPMDNICSIRECWNAKHTSDDNDLIFSAESYNAKITPKQNITFGFIASGLDTNSLDNAEFYTGSMNTNSSISSSSDNNSSNNSSASGSAFSSSSSQNLSAVGSAFNSSSSQNLSTTAQPIPVPPVSADLPDSQDDWLYAQGSKIVDKDGNEVRLTGVNWFGYNTGTNTFDGLWAADLNSSIESIADHGFNLLRIPMSAELIKNWSLGIYPEANYNKSINSYLNDKNSLEIFDYVINCCHKNGLKIMIDIHSAKTDAMGHNYNVWYKDNISEDDYINALSWIAERYKNDDTILAYDLKNEPHGKPGENPKAIWNDSSDINNWKNTAQKTAYSVLQHNPNVLIVIEGTEIYPNDLSSNSDYHSADSNDYYFSWWGGNLRGVRDYPVNLGAYQNKVVYSPHDYGPAVYKQPWFYDGYTYESLYNDYWKDSWMYIHDDNIAPLLIGEWGGYMSEPNLKWMTYLRQLIINKKINHTFWCFNANSGDTGGLVYDDFTTWDENKYNFVKEALWQKNGKFIGLDHKIPLGKNGQTLTY